MGHSAHANLARSVPAVHSHALHAAFIVFWFLLYAAFTGWVLFGLAPREHHHEQDHEDEREPEDLPLAA